MKKIPKKINLLDSSFTVNLNFHKEASNSIFIKNDSLNIVSINHNSATKFFRDWLIQIAREQIGNRVTFYSKEHGFEFNRVAIKNQRSRWGSCSTKKNLNFNWKLILTPSLCLDYVVVHELCHLKQMNHSKNFWNLVEEIMPDYKLHRRKLKNMERELSDV
jgi:predicted metal-dependent hydrolase